MKHNISISLLLALLLIPTLITGANTVGDKAPELNATDWLNSAPLTLASLKGRVVVVEFWATWCPPCRRTIPHLIKMYKENLKKPITFISLTRESKSKVVGFMRSNPALKMPYPLALGSTSSSAYGVRGIPHAFVIGPDGKIIWRGHPMSGGFKTAVARALTLVKDSGKTPDSPGKAPDDQDDRSPDKDSDDNDNKTGDSGSDGGDGDDDGDEDGGEID